MPYRDVNLETLQQKQHFHVPAIGGIDSMNPKSLVAPGTLMDCLNYEVTLEAGYAPIDGLLNYRGGSLDAPTRFFQASYDDSGSTTKVTDLVPGVTYTLYKNTATEIGKIRFLGTDVLPGGFESPTKIMFDLISGTNAEIIAFLSTESADAFSLVFGADEIIIDDSTIVEPVSTHTAYLDAYTKVVGNLENSGANVPGVGAITGMFFLDDQLYVARDEAGGTYAELHTVANTVDQLTDPTWTKVDLGYEVEVTDIETEPTTLYSRQFVEEVAVSQAPVGPRLGTNAESVITADSTYPQSIVGRWREPNSALSDSSGDTYGAIAMQRMGLLGDVDTATEWEMTDGLKITGFNLGDTVSDGADITGIEVTVRHGYKLSFPEAFTTTTAKMNSASLVGVTGTTDNADTTERTITNGGTTYTMYTSTLGGSSDKWGAEKLDTNQVFTSDFGIQLDFATRIADATNASSGEGRIIVSWVKIKLYFTDSSETVYFWDGANDIATGNLVNANITEGRLVGGSAVGYFTLYDVTQTAVVTDGVEIRTEAAGAGSIVAIAAGDLIENTLPSSAEMLAAESMMVTEEFNFFIDPAKEAVYGTTGASPSFHFNGTHFWYTHTPVPDDKDTPRYIALHQNHLVLGFDSGSILLSPAGRPSIYSGVLGALEFGFSDRITGLINLNGNALGIVAETSIHALIGTSVTNFTTQTISTSSGALDYTVADVGQPTYLDFRGISNIQATQTYGDFGWGRLSQSISKDIQGKIQKSSDPSIISSAPVLAIAVKNKNQYRIYFADGTITTMTLFGADGSVPMFTRQDYTIGNSFSKIHFVPTAYATTVNTDGKERIAIGLTSGDVYIVDTGNPGIVHDGDIVSLDRSLTFNPFFVDAPFLNIKFSEVMMHLKTTGFTDLNVLAGVNFLEPASGETVLASDLGTMSDPVEWNFPFDRVSGHVTNITDGFVFKVEGVSDGTPSHIIQALTYKGTPLGDRNSSPKQY